MIQNYPDPSSPAEAPSSPSSAHAAPLPDSETSPTTRSSAHRNWQIQTLTTPQLSSAGVHVEGQWFEPRRTLGLCARVGHSEVELFSCCSNFRLAASSLSRTSIVVVQVFVHADGFGKIACLFVCLREIVARDTRVVMRAA